MFLPRGVREPMGDPSENPLGARAFGVLVGKESPARRKQALPSIIVSGLRRLADLATSTFLPPLRSGGVQLIDDLTPEDSHDHAGVQNFGRRDSHDVF